MIDINEPCLAWSPDGNVTIGDNHGLVEFKCSYSASEFTPAEAVQQLKSKFACKLNSENGSLQLKRSHNYYYQVQGQLAITGHPWCDFVISLAAPPLRIIVEGSGVSSIKQLYQWNLNYVTFSRVIISNKMAAVSVLFALSI